MSTPAGQVISDVARAGDHATAREMQSEVGKQRNFEQAAEHVGAKMQAAPETITQEDAAHLHSREARATGQANPPQGSLSSAAESLAAQNEGRAANATTAASGPSDPVEQSARDRLNNFEQVAEAVAGKMSSAPDQVTKEEADLLHSREQRAFGETSKGGIASQAQSLAADKQKST